MSTPGKVPMFRMRPQLGTLVAAVVVLLLGLAIYYEAHQDPGNLSGQRIANLALAACVVIAGLLAIVSTGRMWFGHLWHDRYKNKKFRRPKS